MGIGTTNPGKKLDVNGDLGMRNNFKRERNKYFDNVPGIGTTNPGKKLDVNGDLGIRNNFGGGTSTLTGNEGIGTTNPEALLHVQGELLVKNPNINQNILKAYMTQILSTILM